MAGRDFGLAMIFNFRRKAMTSGTATQISEQTYLNYALGLSRVRLSHLSDSEFLELMRTRLGSVNVGELRGFTKLREMLARHGQEQRVTVAGNCSFVSSGRTYVTLDTQAIRACRGALHVECVYHRYESTDTTTDFRVAQTWGNSAYVSKATTGILVWVRLSNNRVAHENLMHVQYVSTKVPHKDEYTVNAVVAQEVPLEQFRTRFGKDAGWIARDLIWEMSNIIRQTCDTLSFKMQETQKQRDDWEHLSNCITE